MSDPLVADAPQQKPAKRGLVAAGALNHFAAATGIIVGAMGAMLLLVPTLISPLTGLEAGTGASILGIQWAAIGTLLAMSGLVKTRVATIYAGEFVLLCAASGLVATLFDGGAIVPTLVYGAIAFLGFISSAFARLADKADLKRELLIMQEQANKHANPQS